MATLRCIENPWRIDFPQLCQPEPIIYFDNAATTLKPLCVTEALIEFYTSYTASVHRGAYWTAEKTTTAYETTRQKTAAFIGADSDEIIFTYNCTYALNLLAQALQLNKDDEVITSILEHHSNLLPWQRLATTRIAQIDAQGNLDVNHLQSLINPRTRVITLTYVSNILGIIQPLQEVIQLAKQHGILTVVDAAQAIGHVPINVKELGCDFLVFSAHKMLGPSGVGVIYANRHASGSLKPVFYGGGMVEQIAATGIVLQKMPHCFEAGTPNIEGIIGFGAALDYLQCQDRLAQHEYTQQLCNYLIAGLKKLDVSNFCFAREDLSIPIITLIPHKKTLGLNHICQILSDSYNIALRDGYHCSQPLFNYLNITGCLRISLFFYNNYAEIDHLFDALDHMRHLLC